MEIQVRFTAFSEPESWEVPTGKLAPLDASRVRWDRFPAGLLPAIHVGQVWRGYELVATPEYEYEEFQVEIRNERYGNEPGRWREDVTCSLVWDFSNVQPPPGSTEGNFPLIPLEALRVEPRISKRLSWDARLPQSGVAWSRRPRNKNNKPGILGLRINIPGSDDSLFIPCTEVVRYYYANSSNLTNRLLTGFHRSRHKGGDGPRHLDEVYDLEHSKVVDGVPHIHLRMNFEKEDSLIAGRLRYDDEARRRALVIGAVLQAAESENSVPLLEAEIPFEGPTTLGVHGMWMKAEVGGRQVGTFYVFWIHKCTGPWPFSQLISTRESQRPEGEDEPGDNEGDEPVDEPRRPGTPPPRGGSDEPQHPEPPSLATALRKVKLARPAFEPDTGPLEVEFPVRTPSGKPGGWGGARPEPQTEGSSPQPGTHGKSERSRSSMIHDLPKPDDAAKAPSAPARLQISLEIFRDAVERAASESGWILTWRRPGGEDGDPVFPFRDASRKRPKWCCLEDGSRRHVLIAELSSDGRYVYLLEAERRPHEKMSALLLSVRGGRQVSDANLSAFLKRCVDEGAAGKRIWGTQPKTASSFVPVRHKPALEEETGPKEREEHISAFAQSLRRWAQSAFDKFVNLAA